MFHFGALSAAILHGARHEEINEMSLLPESDEELLAVFKDDSRLRARMPCGGSLQGDYKVWVDKMCR